MKKETHFKKTKIKKTTKKKYFSVVSYITPTEERGFCNIYHNNKKIDTKTEYDQVSEAIDEGNILIINILTFKNE